MGLLTILYTIFIRPLELLFEIIYVVADRIIQNPGLSIIALSLAVSFLVLPLYRRADKMQQEERDIEEKLDRGVRHIRETFSGDERFLMLSTYYRQNGYKPYYVLKSSVSLLLQIPFFIAAYRFLSGLALLKGASFGPIADLGAPDGMLRIGSLSVNLLPILMTAVNVISGMIYTKGMSLKNKIQLYGMAAVFLVLLYRSPAGLVFYWTLNNLFSLVKNLFYKLKDPGKVFR
ncbi:MAG: YidC/Oxa1 family membrane protein insertase, partial [Lachnospiraceae bacterium]|nr:YidC/Oxa1 family membrane protein insertase [Lachnospiraceae bacterium]